MFDLRTIVWAVLALSCATSIALFGQIPAFRCHHSMNALDRTRNTPISVLHRLLWVYIPRLVRQVDALVTGGRLGAGCLSVGNYLLHEKHPVVVAFFLTLLSVCEYLFIPIAWPRVSLTDHLLIPAACALPYATLYLSVYSDPGYITSSNHQPVMQMYPYDQVLFHPGVECSTCRFEKPARSKHCSICKHCISKEDHHCIWINNCVGRGNHHYFLLLLLSSGVLLTYATYLTHNLLGTILQSSAAQDTMRLVNPPDARIQPHWSTGLSWRDYFHSWGWAITQEPRLGIVGLLCLLCSPLVWGLLIFHLYLIWGGMTTNESAKWSDWKDDIADGLVFKSVRQRDTANAAACLHRHRGYQVWGNEGQGVLVDWPVTSDQVLRIEGSAQSPRLNDAAMNLGEGDQWTRVRSLAEVDNIYDLGFWANLKDVFIARQGL